MGSQPLLKGNKDAILFNVYAPLIIGIFAKLVIHFIFRELILTYYLSIGG
jgi:hypothetical protein